MAIQSDEINLFNARVVIILISINITYDGIIATFVLLAQKGALRIVFIAQI